MPNSINNQTSLAPVKTIGTGKTIVLLMPTHVGLSDLIIENLQHLGFHVVFFTLEPYHYKNFVERGTNTLRKLFLRDTTYKTRQSHQVLFEQVRKQLPTISEYCVVIRADIFPMEVLEYIKAHTRYMVGYQWDGLGIYPKVFERIGLFDKFFVFDKTDIEQYPQYNLGLLHNFYFDFLPILNNRPYDTTHPIIYFLASHNIEKLEPLLVFLQVIKPLNLNVNFLVGNADKTIQQKFYTGYPITCLEDGIDYQENLLNVQRADVLVDFVFSGHNGLSLRFFEALYYQKKLITNNPTVLNYDFYHADNIFVWDGVHLDETQLVSFLKKPYHVLPNDIIERYSFKSWITQLLSLN